jgi:hypothetical protein
MNKGQIKARKIKRDSNSVPTTLKDGKRKEFIGGLDGKPMRDEKGNVIPITDYDEFDVVTFDRIKNLGTDPRWMWEIAEDEAKGTEKSEENPDAVKPKVGRKPKTTEK